MAEAGRCCCLCFSGSTGKPKGILHTCGGYMIYSATTFKYVFDLHDDDVFWCTADVGWITGHTYVTYGPLACGATGLLVRAVQYDATVFILVTGNNPTVMHIGFCLSKLLSGTHKCVCCWICLQYWTLCFGQPYSCSYWWYYTYFRVSVSITILKSCIFYVPSVYGHLIIYVQTCTVHRDCTFLNTKNNKFYTLYVFRQFFYIIHK